MYEVDPNVVLYLYGGRSAGDMRYQLIRVTPDNVEPRWSGAVLPADVKAPYGIRSYSSIQGERPVATDHRRRGTQMVLAIVSAANRVRF